MISHSSSHCCYAVTNALHKQVFSAELAMQHSFHVEDARDDVALTSGLSFNCFAHNCAAVLTVTCVVGSPQHTSNLCKNHT
eukprot:22899-Amphidinium_carterae.1